MPPKRDRVSGYHGTLLNGRELGTFVAITDSVGDASYPIPLPNDPAFYDQGLFVQWACLDATVNNLGVTFSNGVRLLLKR